MPGIKISQLPEPSTNNTAQIAATDILPVARSGTTQGITGAAFINALSAVGNGTSLVGTRTFDINSGVTLNVNSLSGVSPVNITTNNGTVSLNVNNLVTDVNSIASNVATISSTFVKQICAGAGISISPLNGRGIVTVSTTTVAAAPIWYLGQTNNLLHSETGGNRLSKQVSDSTSFTSYIQSIVSTNRAVPVPPYSISVTNTQLAFNGSEGSVMLQNGHIFNMACYGGKAQIYDPDTDSMRDLTAPDATVSGGCTLLADGSVFILRQGANQASLIFNPINETFTACGGTHWALYTNSYDFYSCALLPDGRVYVNPSRDLKALIYDPVTNTTTQSNNAATGGGSTCVTMRDGRVYRIPGRWNASYSPTATVANAYIYNPNTNNFEIAGGTFPVNTWGWFNGCTLADGRVLMAPNDIACGGARIYNPTTNQLDDAGGALSWDTTSLSEWIRYSGLTLLPNGNVFCGSTHAASGLIYDPYNKTTTILAGAVAGCAEGGAHLCKNGNVVTIPYPSASGKIIRIPFVQNFDMNTLTSPYFRHSSY